MTKRQPAAGHDFTMMGAWAVVIGLVIIVWPERGLVPHPMAFPPSASTRHLAPYAVAGYPGLGVGLLFLAVGAMARSVERITWQR